MLKEGRKLKFTTISGIAGWILVIVAALIYIYVATRVVTNPSSPKKTELTLFIGSVLLEALGILFLIIWLQII